MGGVVDGELGIANKPSPQKAAIEKVQAELRQEYGVRDERKRELAFLEKGGNPLEFKLGVFASVSVQSTSVTNQHPDQFVTSEAKDSFAINASPHGDSVESSGRPGTTPWDPNSADNLLLFDAENEFPEGGWSLLRRSSALQSEQSFLMDGDHKNQERGDSTTFSLPRKAYKRRYRARPNHGGAKLISTNANPAQDCHGTSLPTHHVPKGEVLLSDTDNQHIISNHNLMPTSPSNEIPNTVLEDGQDIELDGLKSFPSTKDQVQVSDVIAPENPFLDQCNQQSLSVVEDTSKQIQCYVPEAIQSEEMAFAAIECNPVVTTENDKNQSDSFQLNDFNRKIGESTMTDTHINSVSHVMKLLDSESSCTQTNLSIDGNNDSEMCTRVKNLESNGDLKNQTIRDGTAVLENDKFAKEMKDTEGIDSFDFVNKECTSSGQSKMDKDSLVHCPTQLESAGKPTAPLVDNHGRTNKTSSDKQHQNTFDVLKSDLPVVGDGVSAVPVETHTSPRFDSELACKIDEDSILKEAQIIEAKRKRIAELSVATSPVKICQKSQWDYVLEEMAWLANDFAQERIWKLAAASQMSYGVAVASRLRKQERRSGLDAKRVAHKLAKVVTEFWHSIESEIRETSEELEEHRQKNGALSVRSYAFRFLKCHEPNGLNNQVEVPYTPDRISDSGVLDLSWEDSLTEENLFYAIPPGAMETYRMEIEAHMAQQERIGSSVQEEVETSACDVAVDFESHDYAYDEDEGETNIYNIPMSFEARKSSRYGQNKRKHLTQAYGARQYEVGSDMTMQCMENKLVTSQFALLAKRPGSNINVSIPTKRMRTASRRVISPFGAGASGCIQVANKTDASSYDNSSFQDDQSTPHGGLVPNSSDVESAGEFENQLPFDSAEVSKKPKKKKKAKHLNATYEHRWQVDSSFQSEQFQSHFQKRNEIHRLESNGNNGLLGQPIVKKPKLMRQSQDNSFDNIPSSAMSVPSPVGSQMSNMSNSNKFIKMLGGRDRGRKHKLFKMPSGKSAPGSTWSLFEDQALVVLAHDLGPNWELVSDAFNSTLHFKYIYRKAKECKERHICLTDKSSGDGADSADDSGSSQSCQSTLPGIPKGSARQLFQRLQGPMEEETLKSHFEKIIKIGQKQNYRKPQNDNQDKKLCQRPHSSHAIALSQVCPNNPNGGPLTPLDLCDESNSGPDVLPQGYQGAHSSGLTMSNQGPMTQMLPASGATTALQGASNMIVGNNFSSSPGPLNTFARDARYGFPRSGSLPAEEHQRMHLYNQMLNGRDIPQSSISASGAVPGTDRGARMLSSGSGMGMMSIANRNMSIPRSGLQGVPSSSMVNSSSVVSPSGNMHTGVGTGQGSSLVRPREAMNMLRPGLAQDPQRQMAASDLPTPGNSQGVAHFGGLNSSYSNQTTSPSVSSYPIHHQPSHLISPQQPQVLSPHQSHFQGSANHASNSQQQAYASFRLAKERQLQHRYMQQQQQPQQFAASNSLMSHVQSQPQLPVSSSPMQNSPQGQPQTSSPAVSLSTLASVPSVNAMPQQLQKHLMPTQGVARNAQSGGIGLSNQSAKPRPRQQNQPLQVSRQHPQQRQQLQALQQAKVVKGVGRGNLMVHQNIPSDISLPNGVSINSGNQMEKGEPVNNSMQSQGLYAGSAQNCVQPSRQYTASQSNQTVPQQKIYSNQGSSSSKHLQPTPQSDNRCQGHVPSVSTPVMSAVHQPSSPSAIASPNNQAPPHQKLVNQNQLSLQRLGQPNRQINSDSSSVPQGRDSDADHHPTSSFTGTNAAQVVSQPSAHKWNTSEPLVDTNVLNSPKSLVSMPSNSSESVQAGLGHGQGPSTSSKHDSNAQWQQQQQQQQTQQPHSLVSQPQHSQLLKEGSGSYGRLSDS